MEDSRLDCKRNSNLLGRIAIVLVVGCCCLSAEGKYGGGSGEPNDPYLIYDANHMQAIGADANDWDKHFKLMADIDLSDFTGTAFNIIGYYISWDNKKPFTGTFDGNGHTISNFTYDSNDKDFVGLFGYVDDPNAEIKNLGLIDPNVDAGDERSIVGSLVGYVVGDGTISSCYARGVSIVGSAHIGGLVGMVDGATIHDCYVTGSVVGLRGFVGGLVGAVLSIEGESTVDDCYAVGSVTGYDSVGGLAGGIEGTITNCYSTHLVTGSVFVGGLVGQSAGTLTDCYAKGGSVTAFWSGGGGFAGVSSGTITKCYSTDSVSGYRKLGGLVGGNSGTITNCYASGNIDGNDGVGGLVGYNWNGRITDSYANGSVTAVGIIAGGLVGDNIYDAIIVNSYWDTLIFDSNMCGSQHEGATGCDPNYGKTTAEMKQQSTFKDWDFVNVWGIGEKQTYPYLRRYLAGDINKDGIVNFKDFAFIALQWMEGS